MAVSKELLRKIRQLDPGRNKYHNKNTSCLSKHVHQSKAEANYCNRLMAMQQAGEIYHYITQEPFELRVAGQVICMHIVDFFVLREKPGYNKKVGEVHEVKGFRTDVWELKYKLFRALFPDYPYIIIDKKEETDARSGQAGYKSTGKKALRSEGGMRCNHGEGLKRKGVCVICSGIAGRKRF